MTQSMENKHHAAVLNAARSIREGIALVHVHPPANQETERLLRQECHKLRETCDRLDEVAIWLLQEQSARGGASAPGVACDMCGRDFG